MIRPTVCIFYSKMAFLSLLDLQPETQSTFIIYFTSERDEKYCDQRASVYVYACLSARLSQKLPVQTSPNFMCARDCGSALL